MSDQANTADVLVIGMGPVGLHQIFQLGLLGLRVAAVDSLPEPGGQCRALYADKLIHDIPGLPMVSAQQLSDNLFQQIQPLYPDLHFGQVAQALRPWQEDGVRRGFELTTQTGLCLHARAVVLAAGAGAYQRRPLDLPGAEQWRGTQIFEEPMPAERFAGQHVAVMGGGNEAIDQCLALVAAGAASVSLVHRRARFSRFTTDAERVQAIEEQTAVGRVQLVVGQPVRLVGETESGATLRDECDADEGGKSSGRTEKEGVGAGVAQDDAPAGRLRALVVADADDGHEIEVPLDALILCQGLSPTLAPLESWQLPMEGRYLPVDPATMASAIPGIHAVGDICTYPGKLKLIVSGFAEAARAAQSVAQFIAGKPPLFEYTAISLRQQRRLGVLTEETLATRLRPHLHFPEGL
jgi:ferredoxin--NADP(+) reductase